MHVTGVQIPTRTEHRQRTISDTTIERHMYAITFDFKRSGFGRVKVGGKDVGWRVERDSLERRAPLVMLPCGSKVRHQSLGSCLKDSHVWWRMDFRKKIGSV